MSLKDEVLKKMEELHKLGCAEFGDIILKMKDGVYDYELMDCANMEVNEVVDCIALIEKLKGR